MAASGLVAREHDPRLPAAARRGRHGDLRRHGPCTSASTCSLPVSEIEKGRGAEQVRGTVIVRLVFSGARPSRLSCARQRGPGV